MQKDKLNDLINYSLKHPKEKIIKEIIVDGAEGRYFITSTGKGISLCGSQPKELVGNDNGKGYLYITINGSNYYIHQLVANAFIVDDDKDKTQIHHIDRQKSNNNIENLVRLTPKKHSVIHKILNKLDSLEEIK